MNYTALCSPSARGRHKVLTEHMKPETLTLPLVVHAPCSHLLSLAALCECCSWVWSSLSSVRKSSSACNVNDFVEVKSNWNVQLPVHPQQDRLHWGQACSHLKGVVKGVPFRGRPGAAQVTRATKPTFQIEFVIAVGVTFSQADFNIMITSTVHWNLLFLHQRDESSLTASQFCNKILFFFYYNISF